MTESLDPKSQETTINLFAALVEFVENGATHIDRAASTQEGVDAMIDGLPMFIERALPLLRDPANRERTKQSAARFGEQAQAEVERLRKALQGIRNRYAAFDSLVKSIDAVLAGAATPEAKKVLAQCHKCGVVFFDVTCRNCGDRSTMTETEQSNG